MKPIQLLDHGFVRNVESWGKGDAQMAEAGIIEAARQSTIKGFLGWGKWYGNIKQPDGTWEYGDLMDSTVEAWDKAGRPLEFSMHGVMEYRGINYVAGDERLLRYLYTHKHDTPFEFAGLIIEVKAPIFVFREWHRHRTQSYNEMSARYVPLPNENYLPSMERLMMNASVQNKQAGLVTGANNLQEVDADTFRLKLEKAYNENEVLYTKAMKFGVPKELARLCIPVGRYSQMRASASLRNWLAFLTLRMAPEAQWEIRQYANAVGEIIAAEFPKTWELFSKAGK